MSTIIWQHFGSKCQQKVSVSYALVFSRPQGWNLTSDTNSRMTLIHSTTRSGFPPTKTTLSVEWGQHSWNSLMVVWVFYRKKRQCYKQSRDGEQLEQRTFGSLVLPLSAPLSWHLLPRWCPQPSSGGPAVAARCRSPSRCNAGTSQRGVN